MGREQHSRSGNGTVKDLEFKKIINVINKYFRIVIDLLPYCYYFLISVICVFVLIFFEKQWMDFTERTEAECLGTHFA